MESFGKMPYRNPALPPQRRVLIGLSDPLHERAFLPELQERGELAVERVLTGAQLLARAQDVAADAVLVASDLPGVTPALLADLLRVGVPAVVIAPDLDAGRWSGCGIIIPTDAPPDRVRSALDAALRGEGLSRRSPALSRNSAEPPDRAPRSVAHAVIAVASGAGSPGRTTIALGLAAALGIVAPAILVDADLAGPSLAAHLDADPTRNLFMLAHGDPRTAGDWERALEQETQPLDVRSPHGAILCGVPKPAMRAETTVPLFERAVAELRARYRYTIIDVGADLLGPEAAIHRAALGLADQILLVGSADLVGLARLRAALDLCRAQLGVDPERLALIVNRHDRRHHHRRSEIEWALGRPLAALIPHDHVGIQRALAAQRPLTLAGRSAAGRALLALAERAHDGRIAPLPDAPMRQRWWHRIASGDRPSIVRDRANRPPATRQWRWTRTWRGKSPAPEAAPPPDDQPTAPQATPAAKGRGTNKRRHARTGVRT